MVVAILLFTLGLSGVLVAQGTTQLLAAAVMPLEPGAAASLGTIRPATRERVDATPILRRNIFDHESGDLSRPPAPPEVATEVTEHGEEVELDPNAPPPACDGSMRLVGSFVLMRNPED